MKIISMVLCAGLLAVPAFAQKRAVPLTTLEFTGPSVRVSLRFDFPLDNPLSLTSDPGEVTASRGHTPSLGDWFDLVGSWWTPSSPYGVAIITGRTSAYGIATRTFKPDVQVGALFPLSASRSATPARLQGVPLGASLDLPFDRRLLFTLSYYQSSATVLTVRERSDTVGVDAVEQFSCGQCFVPTTFWDVAFSRTVRDREREHNLKSHYLTAAFSWDYLSDTPHFTLGPTAGGQLWLTRNRVWTTGRDFLLRPAIPEFWNRELLDGADSRELEGASHSFYRTRYHAFVGAHGRLRTKGAKKRGAFLSMDVRRVFGPRSVTFSNESELGAYPLSLKTAPWQATASLGITF